MSTEASQLDQHLWNLIRARIESMPPNLRLSIGGAGEFDKNDLLDEMDRKSEIGVLIVKIYSNYIKSFKKEASLTP